MNKKGQAPDRIIDLNDIEPVKSMDFNDVIGQESLTRFEDQKSEKGKKEKKTERNPDISVMVFKTALLHPSKKHDSNEDPECILLFAALAFGTVSCDPDMVYDHFEKTAGGKWSWDDVKTFNVDMTDTTACL